MTPAPALPARLLHLASKSMLCVILAQLADGRHCAGALAHDRRGNIVAVSTWLVRNRSRKQRSALHAQLRQCRHRVRPPLQQASRGAQKLFATPPCSAARQAGTRLRLTAALLSSCLPARPAPTLCNTPGRVVTGWQLAS
jgi:hypothetical protein